MGEEEPGEGRSTRRGNSMTILVCLKREVMVPPFFVIGLIGLLGFWGSINKANKLNKPDELNEPRRDGL